MKLHRPQVCVSRISGYDSAIERVCVASDSLISGMRRGWALWGGGRAPRSRLPGPDPCDGEATHGASIRHGFLLVQPSAFSRLKRLPFPCRRSAGRRSSGGVAALGLRRLPAHHPSISSNNNSNTAARAGPCFIGFFHWLTVFLRLPVSRPGACFAAAASALAAYADDDDFPSIATARGNRAIYV